MNYCHAISSISDTGWMSGRLPERTLRLFAARTGRSGECLGLAYRGSRAARCHPFGKGREL